MKLKSKLLATVAEYIIGALVSIVIIIALGYFIIGCDNKSEVPDSFEKVSRSIREEEILEDLLTCGFRDYTSKGLQCEYLRRIAESIDRDTIVVKIIMGKEQEQ